VLVLALVVSILRAPVSVVTLFGARSPDGVPEPSGTSVDIVSEDVFVPDLDGRGLATTPEGSQSGDAPDGRWGASPVRPGGLAITLEEYRGGWRVEGGGEEAAALAVIAAHAWAVARTERPTGAGVATGTGVIVTVEAVERPGALHAVVTVLVAIDPDLHRIAVPITFGSDGPAVAGQPWTLPAPTAVAPELTGAAIGDPDLLEAARNALEAIGIPGDRLTALEATDGWPFIARLDDDVDGHPWLRWHLDRFVVSGLPLRSGGGSR
jgi:hypothetical protein